MFVATQQICPPGYVMYNAVHREHLPSRLNPHAVGNPRGFCRKRFAASSAEPVFALTAEKPFGSNTKTTACELAVSFALPTNGIGALFIKLAQLHQNAAEHVLFKPAFPDKLEGFLDAQHVPTTLFCGNLFWTKTKV